MPPFLRLVQREPPTPLPLTLCDERGNEIKRATAVTGRCALKAALLLLAKGRAAAALIQRFDLDNSGVVIIAGPEGHRRGRIVDEDAANVGLAGQEILD